MKKLLIGISFFAVFCIIGVISSVAEPDCVNCLIYGQGGGQDPIYLEQIDGTCYDENKICHFTNSCISGTEYCLHERRCNVLWGCTFVSINP